MLLPTDHPASTLLRRALLSNAAFSAVCGLALIIFDDRLVGLMLSVEYQLWPLGALLIGFALSLVWLATRKSINVAWVRSVIAADFGWVIGTGALLGGWNELLSATGVWMAVATGAVVLLFGELQWIGLRRLQRVVPES